MAMTSRHPTSSSVENNDAALKMQMNIKVTHFPAFPRFSSGFPHLSFGIFSCHKPWDLVVSHY
jgi:hypothetical protein